MKKVVFIKNALILTVVSLILRFAGIIFKVWLSRAVGSEGVGLYQLVLSVYVFISAFASGGICTAVTRLCAEQLSLSNKGGAKTVLKKGITLSLIISVFSLLLTFTFGDLLAKRLLFDPRAGAAVKLTALSLPFMSVASCIRGYFFAKSKTLRTGLTQILEQAVRIIFVAALLPSVAYKGLSFSVATIFLGDAFAEAVSCLTLYICLRAERGRAAATPLRGATRQIFNIALPITAGRYLNSGLRAAENMLVPRALAAFGSTKALASFGNIKGMALPLLFFPSSFLSALSTLLIPEMGAATAKGQSVKIRYAADKAVTLTLISGFGLGAVFFALSHPLGVLIYKSEEVGYFLRVLAPLTPLMYLDSVCDGMLKGLDKQRFLFITTVSDSAGRLLLVPPLVTRFGMKGFLFIMIISNLYTALSRLFVLLKTAGLRFDYLRWLIAPLLSAALSVAVANLIYSLLPFALLFKTIFAVLAAAVTFLSGAFILRALSLDDIRDVIA